MGSKGRMPPPHLRRPPQGPVMVHPDPFGPGMRPAPGPFSHFDMLPPPEVMEQKLAAQHVEMRKLATENQRFAATHGALRQELVAAQHELQMLNAQIGAVKSEREQQMRTIKDKISQMEAELQAAEQVKLELQQARSEAQSLVLAREELMSKSHHLSQDIQTAHANVQQIPALMSELETLRQEYQHCRATFDYDKKQYSAHLESLQVMETNYAKMSREVEKLRAELMNAANVRTGGPYGGTTGNNENEMSTPTVGQNQYQEGYTIHQGQSPIPPASAAAAVIVANSSAGPTAYIGAQSGPASSRTTYDAARGSGFDASRGTNFDAQRGPSYDAQRGSGYNFHKFSSYDMNTGPPYDASRSNTYDPAATKGAAVPYGQAGRPTNAPFRSGTPPARSGSGFEQQRRGGNASRRQQ